jgi:hypothetical protein
MGANRHLAAAGRWRDGFGRWSASYRWRVADPPDDILQVLKRLNYETPLESGDPRYVDTAEARGSARTLKRLAMKFGLLIDSGRFVPPDKKHVLFFGHIGSGKTTELRHYCRQLEGPDWYLVVEVSIHEVLDRNNFEYTDLLMALALALCKQLEAKGVSAPDGAVKDLERWFDENVKTEQSLDEFAATVEAGVKGEAGIPFLTSLFLKFTAALRTNVTYKDELRRVVRNTYTQFADAFNAFIREAEKSAAKEEVAQRFLFVVDGTDKLGGKDHRHFFTEDHEQLLGIEAHVVYTAPLSLKYEGNLVNGIDADLFLPLIKIAERDGAPVEAGRAVMRDMLLRRVAPTLFDGDEAIEALVSACGGHPRELLRLLKMCCEDSDGIQITAADVERAIDRLAFEYRLFLQTQDYAHLVSIDMSPINMGNDEQTRELLYTLALFEYDDGAWQHSHPVIARLEGYQEARRKYQARAAT